MPQAVRITPSGQVMETPVKVSRQQSEDVLWIATGNGGPWTITFDKVSSEPSTYPVESGSPFSQASYTVARGGSNGSTGGPMAGQVGRTYRYVVTDANGRVTHDPDVDVES